MPITEVTVTAQRKRNLGNYESEDNFFAFKASVESAEDPIEVAQRLQNLAHAALSRVDPGSMLDRARGPAEASLRSRRAAEGRCPGCGGPAGEHAPSCKEQAYKPPGEPPKMPGGVPLRQADEPVGPDFYRGPEPQQPLAPASTPAAATAGASPPQRAAPPPASSSPPGAPARSPPPAAEKAAPAPRSPEPAPREPAAPGEKPRVRVHVKGVIPPALEPKLIGLGLKKLPSGGWEAIMDDAAAADAGRTLRTQRLQYGFEVV